MADLEFEPPSTYKSRAFSIHWAPLQVRFYFWEPFWNPLTSGAWFADHHRQWTEGSQAGCSHWGNSQMNQAFLFLPSSQAQILLRLKPPAEALKVWRCSLLSQTRLVKGWVPPEGGGHAEWESLMVTRVAPHCWSPRLTAVPFPPCCTCWATPWSH